MSRNREQEASEASEAFEAFEAFVPAHGFEDTYEVRRTRNGKVVVRSTLSGRTLRHNRHGKVSLFDFDLGVPRWVQADDLLAREEEEEEEEPREYKQQRAKRSTLACFCMAVASLAVAIPALAVAVVFALAAYDRPRLLAVVDEIERWSCDM